MNTRTVYYTVLVLFLIIRCIQKFALRDDLPLDPETIRIQLSLVTLWIMIAHIPYACILKPLFRKGNAGKISGALLTIPAYCMLVKAAALIRPVMTTEQFFAAVTVYLVIFSHGKSFRTILKVYLFSYGLFLTAGIAGSLLGYTVDQVKTTVYGMKHSFGFVHPNTVAHFLFIILTILWYLYLYKKTSDSGQDTIALSFRDAKGMFLTLFMFWGFMIPVAILVRCRTIMVLMLLFPFMQWAAAKAGKYAVGLPWACFAVSLLLSSRIEMLHRIPADSILWSTGQRFIQSGIALNQYGLHLLGQRITTGSAQMVLDGKTVKLYVLDNAYITYGLMHGLIWLIPVLFWLSYANREAFRQKDYALLGIACLMLLFAVMERRGLEASYNFLFLYPLADKNRPYRRNSMGEDLPGGVTGRSMEAAEPYEVQSR